jgi:hypothetical protein
MISIHQPSTRVRRRAMAGLAATVVAAGLTVFGMSSAGASTTRAAFGGSPFTFGLQASPGIASCLPHARGEAIIIPGSLNDVMQVSVWGLPANSDFDLFVIQLPNKPFGVAWYQTDIETNRFGFGSARVQGVFNVETFSVSTGGTTTFSPTHQYHLGLWFNDPNQPFALGCEPGHTSPIVTPFNGQQDAGIQVLNTAEFPDAAGPLSHVHR